MFCNCGMYWPYVLVLIVLASCLGGVILAIAAFYKSSKYGVAITIFILALILIVLNMMLWWRLEISAPVKCLLIVVSLFAEALLALAAKKIMLKL